jgi:exopolysaccharide biosynthesis polyprenyl glycosylphosphotransferase
MLKHRQDGLVFLHGLFLDGLILSLFLLQAAVAVRLEWVPFDAATRASWGLLLMGVLTAAGWNHHALPAMATRLGMLSFSDTCRLTRQQLCRMMAVLFAVGFLLPEGMLPRGFLAAFVALAGGALLAANWLMPRRLAAMLFRGMQLRTLVLAPARGATRLHAWLGGRQYLGCRIVGWMGPGAEAGAGGPPLGPMADLGRLLWEHDVQQVIVDRRGFSTAELERIRTEGEHAGCRVRYFVDLGAMLGAAPATVECDEQYAFAADEPEPLDHPVNCLLKRALDLAVALPMVGIVLPFLILVVWAAQCRQSPGPVFHRQERSGLNRRRFQIFKFRTMHVGAEHLRGRQATRDDARVYPFGRFLRKTSLDEIPQFINVLLGEMSVSGPRPHLLEHDRKFAALVDGYYKRHLVKPGITGLAQSEGFRGEVSRPELLEQRISHDLRYVSRWSLELDLRILAATARQVIRPPRAAY